MFDFDVLQHLLDLHDVENACDYSEESRFSLSPEDTRVLYGDIHGPNARRVVAYYNGHMILPGLPKSKTAFICGACKKCTT